jgi:RNA polymerase sigma factor (sigma-70 family)
MSLPTVNPDIQLQVIRAFNKGSELAFKEIYCHLERNLKHFAWKLIGDHDVAYQIVNDHFVKLWERRALFETYLNIKAFLFISVRNAALNHLKQQQRSSNHLKKYTEYIQDLDHKTETELYETEFSDEMLVQIKQLPDRQMQVLWLFFVENLNAREIAKRLNITESTVNVQKRNVLNTLRGKLAEGKLGLVIQTILLIALS